MGIRVNHHHIAATGKPVRHNDTFGHRRCLIEHGSVRHIHSRQVRHHGLEIQEGFKPALADFRLVRRIGRIPGRVFKHVPQDDFRGMRAVISHPDHRRDHFVTPGIAGDFCKRLFFAERRRNCHCIIPPYPGGHHRIDQRIDGGVTDHVKERFNIPLGRPDMAVTESRNICHLCLLTHQVMRYRHFHPSGCPDPRHQQW